MNISKLNKFFRYIFIPTLVIISCSENISKVYSDKDCETHVSAKTGFWIEIHSKNISKEEIDFTNNNQKIFPEKALPVYSGINFFIKAPIKLKDTINILHKGKKYLLYDFSNITEVAIDGNNHKKINICRISTAKINGKEIKDSNNNILKIVLE